MRRVLYLSLAVIVLAVGGWRWRSVKAARAVDGAKTPTAEVTRGALVVTLPVNGTLESAVETPVRSEIDGTLVEICQDNLAVKPGDFSFQLDTKDLTDQREQLVRDLTDASENLSSQKADGETRVTQAQSDVAAAQESLNLAQAKAQAEREKIGAQVKYAEGETARAQREVERARRLAGLNYIAGTKLRDAEKAYRQQQFALDQQLEQQADVEKRSAEQVQDQETALELAQHALDTAKADNVEHQEEARIALAQAQRKLADVDKKIAQCRVAAPAS